MLVLSRIHAASPYELESELESTCPTLLDWQGRDKVLRVGEPLLDRASQPLDLRVQLLASHAHEVLLHSTKGPRSGWCPPGPSAHTRHAAPRMRRRRRRHCEPRGWHISFSMVRNNLMIDYDHVLSDLIPSHCEIILIQSNRASNECLRETPHYRSLGLFLRRAVPAGCRGCR